MNWTKIDSSLPHLKPSLFSGSGGFNHIRSLLHSWPECLKHIHIPLVSSERCIGQFAKSPLERINAMWQDSSINSAHSWHVYSTATGTCRPCQLSHLNAHLLHYSPGPYKAGCFFGMKMWAWFNKRQVVSVIGIKLSLWKSAQKKTVTFPKINRFDGMLLCLNIFMVKRCRTLDKNMWIRQGHKLWDSCQWLLGQILFLLLGIWSLPRM
jgi:hypothetical protein